MPEADTTRQCRACGERKAESEFYKDSKGRDGLTARCTACMKLKNAAYYAANRGQVISRVTTYREANRDEVNQRKRRWREANPEYMAQYRETHRTTLAQQRADYWDRHRERRARYMAAYNKRLQAEHPDLWRQMRGAAQRVKRALKRGQLVRPNACEWCGQVRLITAAHSSYAQEDRLKVTWLCRPCHSTWDRANPKLFR